MLCFEGFSFFNYACKNRFVTCYGHIVVTWTPINPYGTRIVHGIREEKNFMFMHYVLEGSLLANFQLIPLVEFFC